MGKHRGQPDPGESFDAQFNSSRARGQDKARRGQGHWSDDKVIRDAGQIRQPDQSSSESCGKATVILLSLLGGAAWGVSEVVSRLA